MRQFAFAVAALLVFAAPARAQDSPTQATVEQVDTLTTGSVFPYLREGQTRNVWVWRPSGAPQTPLPTLYMADGLSGLYVAVAHLQPLVEAGAIPPFLVIATDPNPDSRTRAGEYLRGWTGGSDDFAIHERWLIEQVIPWAERTQRAASSREQRFIGGFSNGADLAWQLANAHPEVFGGALIHSPVGASASWIQPTASQQRWVVTGGTQENSGGVERGGQLPRSIAQAIERSGAAYRICIGRWGHTGRAWRELSPGSVVWLLSLGDPAGAATPREQGACRTGP
ncbi:MAG: alpha/beta hydrolase [Hyphomonadaceae bacterium]